MENTVFRQTKHSRLGCSIDLNFHEYKLAIETDENGYRNRNKYYDIKRLKAIEQEFVCRFIH